MPTAAATLAVAAAADFVAPQRWDDLPFANRFVVWTMRLWLAADTGDRTAVRRAVAAFERMGMPDALDRLDTLMGTIAEGARRGIQLAPIQSVWLTSDEVRLVDAVALAQAEGAVDVLMALRPILEPEACRKVRRPCRDFARMLAGAGLVLRDSRDTPVLPVLADRRGTP